MSLKLSKDFTTLNTKKINTTGHHLRVGRFGISSFRVSNIPLVFQKNNTIIGVLLLTEIILSLATYATIIDFGDDVQREELVGCGGYI